MTHSNVRAYVCKHSLVYVCRFVSFFLTVFRIILVGGEMNMCSFAATMRIVVIYWIVCLSTFRNTDIQNRLVCMRTSFFLCRLHQWFMTQFAFFRPTNGKKPVNEPNNQPTITTSWNGQAIKWREKNTHTSACIHKHTTTSKPNYNTHIESLPRSLPFVVWREWVREWVSKRAMGYKLIHKNTHTHTHTTHTDLDLDLILTYL